MKRLNILGSLVAVLCLTLRALAGDHVSVAGAIDKPGDWTVEKIKADLASDVTEIEYIGHDGKHTSHAVPLMSLLKAAGVQANLVSPAKGVDAKDKHTETHFAIVIEGGDGYVAVFSIAELMADLGNRKVYLAIDVDGKPWNEKEAPMKLVVPDDQKPARWVHSVKTITVVKIDAPATQPAK